MNVSKVRLQVHAVFAAVLLLATLPAASAGETEWPQFRGPTGQGISAAANVPVEWNPTKNVAWKVELPGRGWSSPVLSAGKIYLTAAINDSGGSELTLHALCLDATNGKVLWNTELFRPDAASTATMHRKNSPASPTPIIAGERLYTHFGHMGTAALDLTGKILWRQNEVKYSPVHGGGGSPVLVGESLIFNADGAESPFIIGLDANSGTVRWKTLRNFPAKRSFSFSTPLAIEVNSATQVVSPASAAVGAYDPQDGRELWRVTYPEGYSVIPRPAFAHGLVFVSSGFDKAVLYAIKAAGAAGDATKANVVWSQRKGAPNTPSAVVTGDEIYFVSDSGIATCADARTGKVHWNERVGGDFSASPIAAEGRIYFQNETGIGTVVRAAKTFQVLARNDLRERTFASPAVIDGALFIRSEMHLWKIGQ